MCLLPLSYLFIYFPVLGIEPKPLHILGISFESHRLALLFVFGFDFFFLREGLANFALTSLKLTILMPLPPE
jgi:hypothetical protein